MLDSGAILRKTLGVLLLVITAGLASCQSFWASWTAHNDAGRSADPPLFAQPMRRN